MPSKKKSTKPVKVKVKDNTVPKPHVRIVCPLAYGAELTPNTKQSIELLLEDDKLPFTFDYVITESSYISHGRNFGINHGSSMEAKQLLKEEKFDFLLTLDRDVEFEGFNIANLIGIAIKSNAYIVGAAYNHRGHPNLFCGGFFYKMLGRNPLSKYVRSSSTGICKVDWIGMGFTLIHKSVLLNTTFPWFHEGILEYNESGKDIGDYLGEDIAFCIKAFKAGYDIYIDCDNSVKHIVPEVKS